MDITLLTKLVKLANNNSNENEANLAARKVCRMIESANFKFVSTPTNPTEPEPNATYSAWKKTNHMNEPPLYDIDIEDLIEKLFNRKTK